MYENLKNELNRYYRKRDHIGGGRLADDELHARYRDIRNTIFSSMDSFYNENPTATPARLKSKLHSLIAEHCDIVLFEESPFFFEIGARESHSWGVTGVMPDSWNDKDIAMFFANWQRDKFYRDFCQNNSELSSIISEYTALGHKSGKGIIGGIMGFDHDHHSLGYRKLFSLGFSGIRREIENRMKFFSESSDEYEFLSSALDSIKSIIKIANRFADAAEERLKSCTNAKKRKNLSAIIECARHIPNEPPKSFYEGLCMLLFTKEVVASLESIGVSTFGQVDMLLYPLYQKDVTDGILTESKARELIDIFMLYTDIKCNVRNREWPETSTCIQLGGCDSEGNPVYNTITRFFIEEHAKLGLINPKLNCRYSSNSPDEYLKLVGETMVKGHNNFVMINDDVIIPALEKSNVDVKDARAYVNGGCQETMIEGCGHTEGAALYVSLPRILDLCLNSDSTEKYIEEIGDPESFEEFYEVIISAIDKLLGNVISAKNRIFDKIYPCHASPLFSVTNDGCIESGTDYSVGGAKYNFATVALTGLATLFDSIYNIKALVYDEKRISLSELRTVLLSDWNGYEDLQKYAISLPKYGHGEANADAFADKILKDICSRISKKKNHKGGTYIPSLFVYYYYSHFAPKLRATPDGRRNGELMSPGISPSQLRAAKDITEPINSISKVDFTSCRGGNAVIDLMIPSSSGLNGEIMASFLKSCIPLGVPTIQPNFLNPEDLKDARINPEKHKDIVVRISGLSAYFVELNPSVQDEIISRQSYVF